MMPMKRSPVTFRIYSGDKFLREETFDQGIVKIGTLKTSHLRLEDTGASRMHAVVEIDMGGDAVIIDLGSSVGTLVNGTKVNKVKLLDGDEIQIGGTRIFMWYGEDDEVRERAERQEPRGAPVRPQVLEIDLPSAPVMAHNEIHEALYAIVAAIALHTDSEFFRKVTIRKGGSMVDCLSHLSRMAGAFDPLWRQSAAALSVGPGEFGQFMVDSAASRLGFRETLEEAVEQADIERVSLTVPKQPTSSAELLKKMFEGSKRVHIKEVQS